MRIRIFFSWTSELPNATNRGLIESALELATKSLQAEGIELAVDSDTRGEPGSPDIPNTIFEKIERCDMFVGDVSIANIDTRTQRRMPNANVLVELGYAAHALGWDKIIMVFNASSGVPKNDLPFDLGYKRAKIYSAAEGETDRATPRKHLAATLKDAIREIVEAETAKRRAPWIRALSDPLFELLIALDEFDERHSHWQRVSFEANAWSTSLRRVSKDPVAQELEAASDILEIAELCDDFGVALRRHGHGLDEPLAALREKAPVLHSRLLSWISFEGRNAVLESLGDVAALCAELAQRGEKMFDTGRFEQVLAEASAGGARILKLTYWPTDFIGVLASEVRRIARALHMIDGVTIYMDGGVGIRRILQDIENFGTQLRELKSALER